MQVIHASKLRNCTLPAAWPISSCNLRPDPTRLARVLRLRDQVVTLVRAHATLLGAATLPKESPASRHGLFSQVVLGASAALLTKNSPVAKLQSVKSSCGYLSTDLTHDPTQATLEPSQA